MARVSTYLNFLGTTEEAFEHYRRVFGTDYLAPILRMGDMASGPGAPELAESERAMVGHVELPILAGHVLMGTDMLESMGHAVRVGNNTTINLEPDTLDETRRLYDALSDGSTEAAPLSEMPWGWWGTCLDRYGVRWMFNFPTDAA
jgi:PhnB protein